MKRCVAVMVLAILAGCAADPNLTEEQRMERFRLAMQLLTPHPHPMIVMPQAPQLDRCTTTVQGNIANTVCR